METVWLNNLSEGQAAVSQQSKDRSSAAWLHDDDHVPLSTAIRCHFCTRTEADASEEVGGLGGGVGGYRGVHRELGPYSLGGYSAVGEKASSFLYACSLSLFPNLPPVF